ncbi:MAG TPA: histidine kinase dimerization/phosphoacceptor domain -containing protein [Arenibaculum sp.]|nr:histidine kinase dimerization/phosphoacceptor domain -containing protein [Arenibaculum sp.]
MSTGNEREHRAEQLLEQQAALARFGELALRAESLDDILGEACRLVGGALKTDLAKVMERREGRPLLVRAGVGWKDGVVGLAELGVDRKSPGGHALETDEPVVTVDTHKETRFEIPDFLEEHGVRAMVNVIIRGTGGNPPFGVLEVDSRQPRQFTNDDISFLRTYANVLAAAVERMSSTQALRKTADEKQRLLLELQHRIKNNLQFITGLIQIQIHKSRSREAQRALQAVGDRIATLRLVYEKLYGAGEVDRVDLGAYIGELSSSLIRFHADSGKIRLRTDIQSLLVDAEKAIPLGMIANEFITNSLKYAFDKGSGIICVEIREHESGKACMTLWDNGKGLAKEQSDNGGTGLALMEGFVQQIGAAAKWETDGGTRLSVEFAC